MALPLTKQNFKPTSSSGPDSLILSALFPGLFSCTFFAILISTSHEWLSLSHLQLDFCPSYGQSDGWLWPCSGYQCGVSFSSLHSRPRSHDVVITPPWTSTSDKPLDTKIVEVGGYSWSSLQSGYLLFISSSRKCQLFVSHHSESRSFDSLLNCWEQSYFCSTILSCYLAWSLWFTWGWIVFSMSWGQRGLGGLFGEHGLLPLGPTLSWVAFYHPLWDLAEKVKSWHSLSRHFIAFVFLSVKRSASLIRLILLSLMYRLDIVIIFPLSCQADCRFTSLSFYGAKNGLHLTYIGDPGQKE